MIPSFTQAVPPTIPRSAASDNNFMRVAQVDSLTVESLRVGSNISGTVTMGTSTVANRDAAAGTAAVTYDGISESDFLLVTMKSPEASASVGASYSVAFVAAAGDPEVPDHFLITSLTTADPATPLAADVSILQFIVIKQVV